MFSSLICYSSSIRTKLPVTFCLFYIIIKKYKGSSHDKLKENKKHPE